MMTKRLKQAFESVAKLPPKEQNLIAELLLDLRELPWLPTPAGPRQLEHIAEVALHEIRHAKTK